MNCERCGRPFTFTDDEVAMDPRPPFVCGPCREVLRNMKPGPVMLWPEGRAALAGAQWPAKVLDTPAEPPGWPCRFQPGDHIITGDDIKAVVEEVIFQRNMTGPMLLIEFWLDGEIKALRVHAEDCRPQKKRC